MTSIQTTQISELSLTPHFLSADLRKRAVLASCDGHLKDAGKLFTCSSRIEPANEVRWRSLASQYTRSQGIDLLREVYRMDPKHVPPSSKAKLLNSWRMHKLGNGSMKEASLLFRNDTVETPDYMSARMSWGLLEKSEDMMDEARSHF